MERKLSKRDPWDFKKIARYSLNTDFNQMERKEDPKDLRKRKIDGGGNYTIFYLEIFCEK